MGRILVIEDEPGTQLLLQSRLQDLGHEVVTAPTGAMGVMEARSGRFDLFLVDVMLGSGIDGYEVTRRIKGMPHTHGVPVVLVSGQVKGREELHRGYEAGCESFLIKGDMTLLEDVVRAMLRIKSLQDDLGLQNRLLDDHNKRLQEEKARGADLEVALREQSAGPGPLRDLASAKACAMLVVGADGVVALVDRGAREIFGKDLEGKALGQLANGTGLEAYVRDARTEPREGFRFDLAGVSGREARKLTANIVPLMVRPGHADRGYKVVLLQDAGKRQVAAEMLRLTEQGVPRRELGPLVEAARYSFHPSSLLGISPQISDLRAEIMRIAPQSYPVLITGEAGVGKARSGRALHFGASRSGPFVPLDCGSISTDGIESELFGHAKGAFAEALADRPGLLAQAHLGTLYLSRLESLPMALQKRLAHYLETGNLRRMGAKKEERPKTRIVGSMTMSPEQAVASKRLDPDLLSLMSRICLEISPLRERLVDVPILAQAFLARFGAALGTPEFSNDSLWVLENYDWPGNVRELEGFIERACAAAEQPVIDVEHLPQALRDLQSKLVERNQIAPARRREERTAGTHLPNHFGMARSSAQSNGVNGAQPTEEEISLELYEKKALLHALDRTGGDKLAAARLLKIGKSTLYRKLKRYDIK